MNLKHIYDETNYISIYFPIDNYFLIGKEFWGTKNVNIFVCVCEVVQDLR